MEDDADAGLRAYRTAISSLRTFKMRSTKHISLHIAFWLALALTVLAPGSAALANCRMAGQSAMQRACCVAHTGACCHTADPGSSHCSTSATGCPQSGCSCDLVPIQDKTPLRGSPIEHWSPATLVTDEGAPYMSAPRRGPPIACAGLLLHIALPSASPPRAPPFQG